MRQQDAQAGDTECLICEVDIVGQGHHNDASAMVYTGQSYLKSARDLPLCNAVA